MVFIGINKHPAFFTKEEMKTDDFKIRVIADVTCDIAPEASIPATIKAASIPDPVFGYDRFTASEIQPFQAHSIDMMTIDNLPNELPRDASEAFGKQFMDHVLADLLNPTENGVIARGMMTKDGALTERFQYLTAYVQS